MSECVCIYRGKNCSLTLDSMERRMLKLIKRKLQFAYNERHVNQETVIGSSAGVCVRVSLPSSATTVQNSLYFANKSWKQCYHMLIENIHILDNWKLYEVIQILIRICGQYEDFYLSNFQESSVDGNGTVHSSDVSLRQYYYKHSVLYASIQQSMSAVKELLIRSLSSEYMQSQSMTVTVAMKPLRESLIGLLEVVHSKIINGVDNAFNNTSHLDNCQQFDYYCTKLESWLYQTLYECVVDCN